MRQILLSALTAAGLALAAAPAHAQLVPPPDPCEKPDPPEVCNIEAGWSE